MGTANEQTASNSVCVEQEPARGGRAARSLYLVTRRASCAKREGRRTWPVTRGSCRGRSLVPRITSDKRRSLRLRHVPRITSPGSRSAPSTLPSAPPTPSGQPRRNRGRPPSDGPTRYLRFAATARTPREYPHPAAPPFRNRVAIYPPPSPTARKKQGLSPGIPGIRPRHLSPLLSCSARW